MVGLSLVFLICSTVVAAALLLHCHSNPPPPQRRHSEGLTRVPVSRIKPVVEAFSVGGSPACTSLLMCSVIGVCRAAMHDCEDKQPQPTACSYCLL